MKSRIHLLWQIVTKWLLRKHLKSGGSETRSWTLRRGQLQREMHKRAVWSEKTKHKNFKYAFISPELLRAFVSCYLFHRLASLNFIISLASLRGSSNFSDALLLSLFCSSQYANSGSFASKNHGFPYDFQTLRWRGIPMGITCFALLSLWLSHLWS